MERELYSFAMRMFTIQLWNFRHGRYAHQYYSPNQPCSSPTRQPCYQRLCPRETCTQRMQLGSLRPTRLIALRSTLHTHTEKGSQESGSIYGRIRATLSLSLSLSIQYQDTALKVVCQSRTRSTRFVRDDGTRLKSRSSSSSKQLCYTQCPIETNGRVAKEWGRANESAVVVVRV